MSGDGQDQGGTGAGGVSPDDPLANVTPIRPDQAPAAPDPAPDPVMRAGGSGGGDEPPETPDEAMRERLRRAAVLPHNDYGNGQRFILHFGEDCMFVPRVGWFTWTGRVWAEDEDMMAVRRRAQRLSRLIEQEAPFLRLSRAGKALLDSDDALMARQVALRAVPVDDRTPEQAAELAQIEAQRKEAAAIRARRQKTLDRLATHARSTGNSEKMKNALAEAQVDLGVGFEALDAAPLDVNTESGVLRFSVLDLSDEGGSKAAQVALIAHDRGQRNTKIMPVAYDPGATCPRWEAFLERVQPDREMREFLKRWMGLSMTALPQQRMAFLYGSGANGKSVFVDTLARIMGGYAATARVESITGNNRRGAAEATPDLIPLMNARFVRTSEAAEGAQLDEALIKQLTGGEAILMRQLHQAFMEVTPVFKLTMSGNHKPVIKGGDDGIWRRVMLVPFYVQIPEAERRPFDEVVAELYAERSGILNWLIEGLSDYLEGGLGPPAAVVDATQEYREESDPIGQFLIACCVVTGDPEDAITSKDLTDAFAYHMIERGMSPWKPATFTRQIAGKARHWRHPHSGKSFSKSKASISQYLGLRLTDAFGRRFRNAPKDQHGRPLSVSIEADTGSAPDPDPDF